MHKSKNGSLLKKPQHLNYLFQNLIKKENLIEKLLNKNGSWVKIKMKVHSRNHYTLTIYLEIKIKKKLNLNKI